MNILLIDRYTQLIIDVIDFNECFEIAPDEENNTSLRHLLWMLQEISENESQTLTKKHRWLGFIQGVLIAKGYTTVSEEREATRSMLNGD